MTPSLPDCATPCQTAHYNSSKARLFTARTNSGNFIDKPDDLSAGGALEVKPKMGKVKTTPVPQAARAALLRLSEQSIELPAEVASSSQSRYVSAQMPPGWKWALVVSKSRSVHYGVAEIDTPSVGEKEWLTFMEPFACGLNEAQALIPSGRKALITHKPKEGDVRSALTKGRTASLCFFGYRVLGKTLQLFTVIMQGKQVIAENIFHVTEDITSPPEGVLLENRVLVNA